MLLSSLDCNKANGHDNISARMLKATALSITSAVTKLFNISISLGEIPNEWKMARVSPIPKGTTSPDPAKYRPISLLSILSKLLETPMRNVLLYHLQEHCPLSDNQWGFTKGKSTTGALLAATDQWHQWLDDGLEICTVFFDYSKAFDTVPHRLLLQSINVHHHLLRSYLCGRTQYVCVGGSASRLQPVISGVPQGSVLGPLLFNFYINDISLLQLSAGTMSLYADDVMLYRIIRSQADFISLQADVDTLCIWTDKNRLKFNATKCKYMVISRKRQPIVPSSPIAIKDTPLVKVFSYKYLGVWITSTLN